MVLLFLQVFRLFKYIKEKLTTKALVFATLFENPKALKFVDILKYYRFNKKLPVPPLLIKSF